MTSSRVKLPKFFMDQYWLLKPSFKDDGVFVRRFKKEIVAAVEAGVEPLAVNALLLSHWTGRKLREDTGREERFNEAVELREKHRKPSDFELREWGFIAGDLGAYFNSKDAIDDIESRILYGFMLHQQLEKFTRPIFWPLSIPLGKILYSGTDKKGNDDPQGAAFQALRQRYRRILEAEPKDGVRELSESYFAEVYSALPKKIRLRSLRTLADRT